METEGRRVKERGGGKGEGGKKGKGREREKEEEDRSEAGKREGRREEEKKGREGILTTPNSRIFWNRLLPSFELSSMHDAWLGKSTQEDILLLHPQLLSALISGKCWKTKTPSR